MSDLFVTRENNYNLRNFEDTNYFLQRTSNKELDPGKIKVIENIKQI